MQTRFQLGRRGLQGLRGAADLVLQGLAIGQRVVAGDGFNPAHAGRHTAFADDLEQADVAAGLDMRAAAQLLGAADGEHAHGLAVFLAEQHHRAALLCVIQRHHFGAGRRIGQHFGVDDRLDLGDLLGRHGCVVREVEAGALGIHQRALLLHMAAQHFAQGLVHQMGGAVVAHRLDPQLGVDLGGKHIADRDRALEHATVVAEHIGLDLQRVFHGETARRVTQFARVTGLAAALGVKRRVIQHHHGVVAGLGRSDADAVDVDGRDLGRLTDQMLVAVEGGRHAGIGEALGHLELAGRASLGALACHRGVKAGLINRHIALAADVGGQVDGEAKGVMQLEGQLAIELLQARCQRAFQNLHAIGDGLEEALFFLT